MCVCVCVYVHTYLDDNDPSKRGSFDHNRNLRKSEGAGYEEYLDIIGRQRSTRNMAEIGFFFMATNN